MNNFRITERMRAMESQVIAGEPVADIGTDHGYVPLDLLAGAVVPRVIMTDVNSGPLERARSHAEEGGFSPELYELRLGSGLEPLETGEVSSVIIAGMGGELIADILAKDLSKSHSFKRLILQPRTKSSELRKWLTVNKFTVIKEILVREEERICEIIVTESGEAPECGDSLRFELPELMYGEELFPEFLENYILRCKSVAEGLRRAEITDSDKLKLYEDKLCTSMKLKQQLKL